MKKKLLNFLLLGVLTFALSISFVACSDYDDDIDDLQEQIDGLKKDIEAMEGKIKNGNVITDVSTISNGVKVTLSDGSSFDLTNGKDGDKGADGSVITIGENGNWFIDNEDTGKPSQGKPGESGTPGSGAEFSGWTLGKDGFWYYEGKATEEKWNTQNIVTVVVDADGNLALYGIPGYENGYVVSATGGLYSMTYIPTAIDSRLGATAFFPVIVYDDYSTGTTPVWAYNSKSEKIFRTLIPGWLDMRYKVHPSSTKSEDVETYAFDHRTAYVTDLTRGTAPGLVVKENSLNVTNGELSVKIQGLKMFKWSREESGEAMSGFWYDDPDGNESDDYYSNDIFEVDQLGFQVTTKGSSNVVTAEYVPAKRLVVEQQFLEIGLTKKSDATTALKVGEYTDLADFYPTKKFEGFPWGYVNVIDRSVASTKAEQNAYKVDLNTMLQLKFAEYLNPASGAQDKYYDLDKSLANYFTFYTTNTGYYSDPNRQFEFEKFGFEGFTRKYYVEGYDNGETNQSTNAPIYGEAEVMKYMRLSEDGKVSFIEGNFAAIGRKPLIRVDMIAPDGKVVMTKLLKLEIVDAIAEKFPITLDHIKDQVVPCSEFIGKNTIGWYIDMDEVYNKVGVSKAVFDNTYGVPLITLKRGATTVLSGYAPNDLGVTGGGITMTYSQPGQRIFMTATDQVVAGDYEITVTFTAGAAAVAKNPVIITDKFKFSYPDGAKLKHLSGMWQGTENMVIYGQATSGNYGEPFLRQGFLENGFSSIDLPSECATLHFELVNKAQYGGNVEIVPPAAEGEKHQILIKNILPNEANNKYVSLMQENGEYKKVKIRVRAYATHGNSTNTYPVINDATNSDEFDVIFVDPVHFTKLTNNKVWLRDKATTANDGMEAPIYRLFNIYDTWLGASTNGPIWNGASTTANGWVATTGEGLRDLHNVKVGYYLDPAKNSDFVMENATITQEGMIKWDNSGDAVVSDIFANVTIIIDYNWAPQNQTTAFATAIANETGVDFGTWFKTFEISIPIKNAATAWSAPGLLEGGNGTNR